MPEDRPMLVWAYAASAGVSLVAVVLAAVGVSPWVCLGVAFAAAFLVAALDRRLARRETAVEREEEVPDA